MGAKRQKIQMELAFMAEGRGEAPMAVNKGTEAPMAKREPEDPALTILLMEQICQRENLRKALQRVRQNKGGPGIDGKLNRYLIGWRGYFGYCQSRSILQVLDCWIRRRLRCVYWRRWKRGKRRFAELRRLDIRKDLAVRAAGSVHGPWRLSLSPALSYAFPKAHFDSLGLALLAG